MKEVTWMLSRPVMDHLTRLAMVYSIIEQIKSVPEALALCRIDVARLQMTHDMSKIDLLDHCRIGYEIEESRKDSDGIKMILSDKENLRLHRHEKRFVSWLTSGMEETVRGTEWLTAVMDQAQIQYHALPEKFVRMRQLWDDMHELLFKIYAVFDRDLEDVEAMQQGLKLSLRMPI
jgi:hypothetical protein